MIGQIYKLVKKLQNEKILGQNLKTIHHKSILFLKAQLAFWDHSYISETFNKHFVDKINKLNGGIDPEYVTDPLEKLKKKMANNTCSFSLKQIKQKELKKILKNFKFTGNSINKIGPELYLNLGLRHSLYLNLRLCLKPLGYHGWQGYHLRFTLD